jgi:hypothetical protein
MVGNYKSNRAEAGLELKLHGARRLTILAWEALKAAKGSVVLISGSAALDPKPGFAASRGARRSVDREPTGHPLRLDEKAEEAAAPLSVLVNSMP